MSTTRFFMTRTVATLALLLAACGGGELLVIPLFTFTFGGDTGGVNSTRLSLFLGPDATGKSSGSFTTVNLNVNDGTPNAVQFSYTGSYAGCDFEIAFDTKTAPPAPTDPVATRYRGRFSGADTVTLEPVGGVNLRTVTLTRSPLQKQDFGC
jgi:hypothetical protein